MGLLNHTNDGHFNVLIVITKFLAAHGPTQDSTLAALVAPEKVLEKQDLQEFRATLNRWEKFGLLRKDARPDNTLYYTLSDEEYPDPKDEFSWQTWLSKRTCEQIMEEKNNPKEQFWETTADTTTDLTRGLAWLLAQDIQTFSPSNHKQAEKQEAEQFRGSDKILLNNDVRWNNLRRWSLSLGFARSLPINSNLLPDPTGAIRKVLPDIFDESDELSHRQFIQRLAEKIPILDGGRYRRWLEEELSRNPEWKSIEKNFLSSTLSLALRCLEKEGELDLLRKADAERSYLTTTTKESPRPFTHVKRTSTK